MSLYSIFFVFYGIYTIIEIKPQNIITIPKMSKNIQKNWMEKVLEWNFGNSNWYKNFFWYLTVILKWVSTNDQNFWTSYVLIMQYWNGITLYWIYICMYRNVLNYILICWVENFHFTVVLKLYRNSFQ